MTIIQFSVATPEHFPETEHFFHDLTQRKREFGDTSVVIEAVPWERMWLFIQNKTLAQSGLDVSEVGTTWLGALADNNLLRPFEKDEIAKIGTPESFSPAAWKNAGIDDQDRALSIPWMSDPRVIYYWGDMLKRVGLDGITAFSSIQETERSLAKLKSAGLPAWGAPTFPCTNNVHHAASWLWAVGQDFICSDERRTQFCQEEAIDGLAAYFSLYKYLPGPFNTLDSLIKAFMEKKVAAIMDGPWLLNMIIKKDVSGQLIDDLGIALPPGPPFVGGSNLVIWNFIDKDKVSSAKELVEEMMSLRVQSKFAQANGMLPVRKELLEHHPFTSNPLYEGFRQATQSGKHPPKINIWGPLENSLVQAFGQIWRDLLESSARDVKASISRHLLPLEGRFNRLLELY